MDLNQISNHELLNRVEKLSRTERKITHLTLCHLVEVETRRLHLDLGYTSLFRYMTVHLQYSEDAAYRRIQAGLLKKMPQLEKSIEAGEVNLTQLQQVQKCLNKEIEQGHKITIQQTEKVLEHIQNKSSFETQKILAVEFNQPIQQIENIKPQRDDSVRTRRALLKRAQHQCEYVHSTTGRCTSKFQLQVDHQRPLALGGSNIFSNLRILCQQHNLSEARRWGIAR